MEPEDHTFEIDYNDLKIQVKPISTADTILYIVYLPGEKIILESDIDYSPQYWIENGEAETARANEIGALIESRLM